MHLLGLIGTRRFYINDKLRAMQILWPDLQQFSSCTQAGDLQGWIDLAGDNQMKIGR